MKRLSDMSSVLNKHAEIWVMLITLVVLIAVVVIWVVSSADLAAIRDYGLLIAATIAFPLGFWRSRVAERQASAAQQQVSATQEQLRTAQRQADAAQRQADTAQQNLLNERYQQGAEMLGSDVLTVRLGGIYALQRLAEEHPQQYHVQIMRLFCAFARHPTEDGGVEAKPGTQMQSRLLREDVRGVMEAISACHVRQLKLEQDAQFQLDLKFANLTRGWLSYADLSQAWLSYANLSHAGLSSAKLSRARLSHADLSHAWLDGADLSRADLSNTILSGAQLSRGNGKYRAKGLTQAQLDEARADPDNPPKLKGVQDAKTGEQLVWRGKPLDE